MAIISFCLGAASVVAASFAHKYLQDRKNKQHEQLIIALETLKSGEILDQPKLIRKLESLELIVQKQEGYGLTPKGEEYLAISSKADNNLRL